MKTHVIQLENHDDVITTSDQMGWTKSARILLVLPARARLFHRRLDIILLQRKAQELGAQLGMVTRDPVVSGHALDLGIAVFETLDQAEKQPWRRTRASRTGKKIGIKKNARRRLLRRVAIDERRGQAGLRRFIHLDPDIVRFVGFGFGLLAVLAIVFLFIPTADIRIERPRQSQQVSMVVHASPDTLTPNISGAVPVIKKTLVIDGEDEMGAGNSETVPDQAAGGVVEFTNLTDQAVQIPAGTMLVAPAENIRFITIEDLNLPGGVEQTGLVNVSAVTPGSVGNVPAGSINSIEGLVGLAVRVSNPEAMTGGSEREALIPDEADFMMLKNRLMDRLEAQAMEQFTAEVEEGQILIPASLTAVEVLEEERIPAPGVPADRLQIRMSVEYSIWTVRQADLAWVSMAAMNATLPDGFVPVENSLTVSALSEPQQSGNRASWEVLAIREIEADIHGEDVIRLALGNSPRTAAVSIREHYELEDEPEIMVTPGWWGRMPFLAFRYDVVVQ